VSKFHVVPEDRGFRLTQSKAEAPAIIKITTAATIIPVEEPELLVEDRILPDIVVELIDVAIDVLLEEV
jgi:hypothetical protein